MFWHYVGQLRFRAYCMAHPNLDTSGAAALLNSLMATVGPPITSTHTATSPRSNARSTACWLGTDAHRYAAMPEGRFAAERAGIRQGLVALRDTNMAQRDQTRAERIKQGLGSRE